MRYPKAPPSQGKLLDHLLVAGRQMVEQATPSTVDGRYLHWDELRYREPPEGRTREQWWGGVRLARRLAATRVAAMATTFDQPFGFVETPLMRGALHQFDRQNVSKILASALGNEDAVTEYKVRLLIEEAISSSVIEGARPTTREVARQMVREQREPTTRDERMILNNWRAMQRIVQLRAEERPLSLDDLLELHRIIGDAALDVDEAERRLRRGEHDVRVEDQEGNVWHTAPPVQDPEGRIPPLVDRVRAMLDFANSESDDGGAFIHPVLRAIISHFWLAYEHPFRDGNGRMARALFYWTMLRHGYELAEFLSISGPIDRKPMAYCRAFAYVETDDADLTYFILHQLDVLQEALDELLAHLKERAKRARELSSIIADFDRLNHRQRALLQKAVRHPLQNYTIEGHATSHGVHYQTARNDLQALVALGYFEPERVGKGKRFRPADKLTQLINGAR